MKQRLISRGLLFALLLVMVAAIVPAHADRTLHASTLQSPAPSGAAAGPVPDLSSLLNFPGVVHIEELTGSARDQQVAQLMAQPEATVLTLELRDKGFQPDLGRAEAMTVFFDGALAAPPTVGVVVVPLTPIRVFLPLVLRQYSGVTASLPSSGQGSEASVSIMPWDLSAYMVAMIGSDGYTLYQAHLTNLDPTLVGLPVSDITFNNMPYFFVTTLQVVGGRVVYWRYWWFNSDSHPNWYYARYKHYWDYYVQGDHLWPWWYDWSYGWYYWRFWYFWSTYFPWWHAVAG
jgi:hypothetical protein